MSDAQEQATRERIGELLTTLGPPAPGTLHLVREGKPPQRDVALDPMFYPKSAVVLLVSPAGDEQCYDRFGYEVFAD